jgi:ATP-dependent HslUV protease subunit HslV
MADAENFPGWHGTTILAVRKDGRTVVAGDGQVSLGNTVVKGAARKVRRLAAAMSWRGSRAPPPTPSPCWSGSRPSWSPSGPAGARLRGAGQGLAHRPLPAPAEAMLIVADADGLYTSPEPATCLSRSTGVAADGSGGQFALAAARAQIDTETRTRRASRAGRWRSPRRICVYTNNNLSWSSGLSLRFRP